MLYFLKVLWCKKKSNYDRMIYFSITCSIRKKRPRLHLIHTVVNCGEGSKETRYLRDLPFLGEDARAVLWWHVLPIPLSSTPLQMPSLGWMPFPNPMPLLGQPALPMEADDLVTVFCVCDKSIYFLNVKQYCIFYFKRIYTYQKTSKHLELDISNNQK